MELGGRRLSRGLSLPVPSFPSRAACPSRWPLQTPPPAPGGLRDVMPEPCPTSSLGAGVHAHAHVTHT